MISKQFIITYVCLTVYIIFALSYENEYGPEYGDEWLLFDDEDGNTHVMNFSTIPNDTRGLICGDAYYYLYTRRNADPEELHVPYDNTSEPFTSQYFNSSYLIKVLAHGWLGSESAEWVQGVKDEILTNSETNVITIDWSEIAKNPIYPWAAFSTRYVGKKTAKLLDAISASYKVDGKHVHLIGHSLGAQIMGYTALFSNLRIQRITGLDPARPFFEHPWVAEDCRLEKSDAEFVDIIHTSGGVLGYGKSQGHADFYPNNGRPIQPGCKGTQSMLEGCSHARSHMYFRESINSEIYFYAYPCESWEKFENGECKENFTYMGYPALKDNWGDYYLRTNEESPFSQGEI